MNIELCFNHMKTWLYNNWHLFGTFTVVLKYRYLYVTSRGAVVSPPARGLLPPTGSPPPPPPTGSPPPQRTRTEPRWLPGESEPQLAGSLQTQHRPDRWTLTGAELWLVRPPHTSSHLRPAGSEPPPSPPTGHDRREAILSHQGGELRPPLIVQLLVRAESL